MTPEERERFRQGMRERCGFGPTGGAAGLARATGKGARPLLKWRDLGAESNSRFLTRRCAAVRNDPFWQAGGDPGSADVGDIVVHGEDLFGVGLVGEDVDHPGEHEGVESAR